MQIALTVMHLLFSLAEINTDKLREMIDKFELTIDIEGLIEETDKDGSGLIDYGEFKAMLS